MLEAFNLEKDWKLIFVHRCTKHHAVLSIRNVKNGVPEVIKIISKTKFDKKIYHVLSRLSDKNLIPVKRIHSYRNWIILHFPLLNPLKEYIHSEGMSLSEILYLINNISEAVTALHENKLLHLDISPDNILVDDDGKFLLGDFSSTRWAGRKGKMSSVTPCYTPPESMDGKPAYTSDQYSFAMLVFALLHNGSVYEPGQKKMSVFFMEEQKKMSVNGISYPDILYSYFEKALSPTPSARYPDVISFASDIQACLKPLCEKSAYRMQLIDKNHPFYQVHTMECPSPQNKHFITALSGQQRSVIKYIPIGVISIFLLLLLVNFFTKQLNVSHDNDATASYSNTVRHPTEQSLPDISDMNSREYIDTPAAGFHILDVSNRNADTLAEVLDEDAISQNWNVLYGENNCFTSLEELSEFPDIQELYLSGNNIASLDALGTLEKLQTLILSDNYCTELSPLSSLYNLVVLDLSGNFRLSQVTCLQQLQNLRLLILSDTSVSQHSIQELQAAIPECEIVY